MRAEMFHHNWMRVVSRTATSMPGPFLDAFDANVSLTVLTLAGTCRLSCPPVCLSPQLLHAISLGSMGSKSLVRSTGTSRVNNLCSARLLRQPLFPFVVSFHPLQHMRAHGLCCALIFTKCSTMKPSKAVAHTNDSHDLHTTKFVIMCHDIRFQHCQINKVHLTCIARLKKST